MSYDFVSRNQGLVRSLPLWGGVLGFAGLLANRAVSGVRGRAAPGREGMQGQGGAGLQGCVVWVVGGGRSSFRRGWGCVGAGVGECAPCAGPNPGAAAQGGGATQRGTCRPLQPPRPPGPHPLPPPPQIAPVVDASSSQSRADVLGIITSAVLLLTGLQWLSLKARPVEAVAQDGASVSYVDPKAKLPPAAAAEIEWWVPRGRGRGGGRGAVLGWGRGGGGVASGRWGARAAPAGWRPPRGAPPVCGLAGQRKGGAGPPAPQLHRAPPTPPPTTTTNATTSATTTAATTPSPCTHPHTHAHANPAPLATPCTPYPPVSGPGGRSAARRA